MTKIHKYESFFEAKDENKEAGKYPNPYPYLDKKSDYTIKSKAKSDQKPDIKKPEIKKPEIKKPEVKKSELEKHPFFKYIPNEILKFMSRGKNIPDPVQEPRSDRQMDPIPPVYPLYDEPSIPEEKIVYNLEDLPIQIGDYVDCEDFEGLNNNQIEFLNAKQCHKVRSVTSKGGRYYYNGEPYVDLGYKIPFKMRRFKKVERTVMGKYKVLFLQFDLPIDTHGEEDTHNFFKGTKKMSDLFEILFKERLEDSFVDFCQYDDIYRVGQDFYIDNLRLKDYDFVFFGFMSNFSTIVKMLISYLDKNNVPYLKYGTYKDVDNKAYEMHLVQSLGYPYIPSLMTSKLSSKVIDAVKEFGFPIIVKDINLNRGEGVWKVESMKELLPIFSGGNKLMLIQKFIPNDGDYRVISVKNKVELVIKKERIEGTKEFRANVARGGKAVKGTLPKDIIEMCEDISQHLVCDIVGFDIIQDQETKEYYVMETNSSPHFPTFSVISEIDIPGIITNYIIKKIKK